jgi:hypothetical protein
MDILCIFLSTIFKINYTYGSIKENNCPKKIAFGTALVNHFLPVFWTIRKI